MVELLLATRNPRKTAEFAQILGGDYTVADLLSLTNTVEVGETGATFEENALLKAIAASRLTDLLVVADDSGLEVESLGGAPGIRSARYAGENAIDAENVAKLLRELRRAGTPSGAEARFYCAIVLAQGGNPIATVAGTVDGSIMSTPKGDGGFGYDPVFVPEGFDQSFAELSAETKNRISHRARAIGALREHL
ncbi:MAG: RdgB/HAM1 family non-canonical purine NTP pyrophosphatase [Chthoniobacterales bacterium]|nr:RdgB/HAM1 family non-canonical purine NTP pyrophosphatase [Chthoniobacterales bacterium]